MNNARVLIVDDNAVNLKLAMSTLEYEGYEVFGAHNAQAAIALLAADPSVDLILMDVALPGMDGLSLTRKLKSDAATRDIPIVILTASAMKSDEQRTMASGADGYLTKPIDVSRFPQQVASYLSKRGWALLIT